MRYSPKYDENGGHFETQDDCQKRNDQYICKCFNFNLWYHKHRYCHHFEVILWFKKMKYRPKHAENGGHFEIQDGRHGDKFKKWQQFDLNSWVPSPSFKTKKSNCSRTSHKYQFRHISNQTTMCMFQLCLA